MGAVVNAIKGLVDLISSLVSFVVAFFQDLVNIVKLLAQVTIQLPSYLAFVLPSTVFTVLILAISIAVVYKIAGRE